MKTQQDIAFLKNKDNIGRRMTCLVDSIERDGTGIARYYGQAPDIDSVCMIRQCPAQPGEFIECYATDTRDYDLIMDPLR
jgi:ribosomal protein S12 methylthiotransferase